MYTFFPSYSPIFIGIPVPWRYHLIESSGPVFEVRNVLAGGAAVDSPTSTIDWNAYSFQLPEVQP